MICRKEQSLGPARFGRSVPSATGRSFGRRQGSVQTRVQRSGDTQDDMLGSVRNAQPVSRSDGHDGIRGANYPIETSPGSAPGLVLISACHPVSQPGRPPGPRQAGIGRGERRHARAGCACNGGHGGMARRPRTHLAPPRGSVQIVAPRALTGCRADADRAARMLNGGPSSA